MISHFRCSTFHSNLLLPLLLFVIGTGTVTGSLSRATADPSNLSPSQSAPSGTRAVSPKLRFCVKGINELPPQEYFELPTFSVKTFKYTLEQHEVEREGDIFICPNGNKPIALSDSSAIPKRTFDEEYQANDNSRRFVFEMLRSRTFIFQNDYLSVGIGGGGATYYSPKEYCIESIQGQGIDKSLKFKICPFSNERPVLPKCCPFGMVLGNKTCMSEPLGENWYPKYLDAEAFQIVSFEKANPVYTTQKLQCLEEGIVELWEEDTCHVQFHPVTDNRMAFVGAQRRWAFIPQNVSVCIDLRVLAGQSPRMILLHCAGGYDILNSDTEEARISLIYMISMYIGSSFHFLTTLVYLITWNRQNIHGKTLSSLTGSLFFMHMFKGNAHLFANYVNLREETSCFLNSVGGQYFMIASFTWLLVVNVDLWWTFRTIRTDSCNSLKRFLIYSACGWGFPLAVTLISLCLEFTFPCRTSLVPVPEYGQYYCFVAPYAQGYYVYYILSPLISLVFIFAVMTLFALYSIKRDTSNLRRSGGKGNDDRNNILLFIKLGVVMGFTWVTEVISWEVTDDGDESKKAVVWIVFDLYNILSAVLIFIIFVCKRATLDLLEQSCPSFKWLEKFNQSSALFRKVHLRTDQMDGLTTPLMSK